MIHTKIRTGTRKLNWFKYKRIHWDTIATDAMLLIAGGLLLALGVNLFIEPHDIAPGGLTGLAIILRHFTGWQIGVTMIVFNIPAFIIGYRHLGGGGFVVRATTAALTYNLSVDVIGRWLPAGGITDEMILNAVFGGVVIGVGLGMIYRAGGTAGAGGIVKRLIQKWTGMPLSAVGLITNGAVVSVAGAVFGWEAALYAVISFYIAGATADYVLEGVSVVKTAMIVTDKPQAVADALIESIGHGVTAWNVEGKYTGQAHTALYCTVMRPQINDLKNAVAHTDPDAFVVIGQGHQALGEGFRRLKSKPPALEDALPSRI